MILNLFVKAASSLSRSMFDGDKSNPSQSTPSESTPASRFAQRVHIGARNCKMQHVPFGTSDNDHFFEHPTPGVAAHNLANYLRGFGHNAVPTITRDEEGHVYTGVHVRPMGGSGAHYIHIGGIGKYSVHGGFTKSITVNGEEIPEELARQLLRDETPDFTLTHHTVKDLELLQKHLKENPPRCRKCREWLDLDDDDAGLDGVCCGCTMKHHPAKSLIKSLFGKSIATRKYVPGEDCPHCGASMEQGSDDRDGDGHKECNRCGKPWPDSTDADPKLSGDGGMGWPCPWCNEVNCSEHPETGRQCYKCRKPVDVVEEGEKWCVHPAPARDSGMRKACASGYPLQKRRKWQGLDVSVENAAGSWRVDKHNDPPKWKTKMACDYGYLRGTEGTDGDHLDVFLGDDPTAQFVYVVDQVNPQTGKFDEQKCMLDFPDAESAKAMYLRHYDTPAFFGSMKRIPVGAFKAKALATLPQGGGMIKSLFDESHIKISDCERESAAFNCGSTAVDRLVDLALLRMPAFQKSQFSLFNEPIPVSEPHHYEELGNHRVRERGRRVEKQHAPTLFDKPKNENIYVVPNHWSAVFHLSDARSMSWPPAIRDGRGNYDHEATVKIQPNFKTIEEAVAFARARGVEPHVDPRCKAWHKGEWPSGITLSEKPDFTNKYEGSTPVVVPGEVKSTPEKPKATVNSLGDVMFIPPAKPTQIDIRDVHVPPEIEKAMQQGATLAVSISGGKDSQALINAMAKLHREREWKGRIFAIHADLGRAEWPQTPGHVEKIAHDAGLPLQIVRRNDGRDLIDHMENRMEKVNGTDTPFWPSSKARYCTSHLKGQPIDVALRAASTGEGETEASTPPKKPAPFWPSSSSRYCTSDLKRGPIDVALRSEHDASTASPGVIVSAEGVRASESRERAKKPVVEIREQITAGSKDAEKNLRSMAPMDALEKRQEGQRVAFDWRPLHDWSDDDVWRACGHSAEDLERRRKLYKLGRKEEALDGWQAHPAYVFGNQRLSCVFCVLGSKNDLKNGAIHNPELFEKYKEMERRGGATFKHKFSLADLDLDQDYNDGDQAQPCDGCSMNKSLSNGNGLPKLSLFGGCNGTPKPLQ